MTFRLVVYSDKYVALIHWLRRHGLTYNLPQRALGPGLEVLELTTAGPISENYYLNALRREGLAP